MLNNLLILTLSALVLSGCISREAADAKLAKGCAAGAEAFLQDGFKIKEIKNQSFGHDRDLGPGYRVVRLTVMESDGWYDAEKEYKCIFIDDMKPFNMSHSASIYQLKMDDQLYGKEGDNIIGSIDDHIKLDKAVQQGMGP